MTNNSGTDLNATHLFFNFFDLNADSATPAQDLGIATEFLIPNCGTSAVVNLFEVRLTRFRPCRVWLSNSSTA